MPLINKSTDAPKGNEQRRRTRDFDGLVLQLDDPNPVARRWAARDLIEFPDASAPLIVRLKVEENNAVRAVILTTLVQIGDGETLQVLTSWLGSEDIQKRNIAIETLQLMPEHVGPVMRKLLTDKDEQVRLMAVSILESLSHRDVEAWLIEVIDHDPAVNVCGAAVDLLTEVATTQSYDALTSLVSRFPEEPYIQFAAKLVLKRIEKV